MSSLMGVEVGLDGAGAMDISGSRLGGFGKDVLFLPL
jgi:hypothetical protein